MDNLYKKSGNTISIEDHVKIVEDIQSLCEMILKRHKKMMPARYLSMGLAMACEEYLGLEKAQ